MTTPKPEDRLKAEVKRAISELRKQFPDSTVDFKPDEQGGAYVVVESVDLGPAYSDETRRSWIGFHIPFSYPFADVYPHHVRRDLVRSDGRPHGEGMSFSRFEGYGRDSIQISRRSNHRDAALETAVHKLLKVIAWASTRP